MPKLETPLDVLRALLVYPEETTNRDRAVLAVETLGSLDVWQLRATQECVGELWIGLEMAIQAKTAEQ
jgi:hypothetical protein